MSEAPVEGGSTSGETPTAEEFKPITSQDDLNKVLAERITRERAKYADYKDLKVKAAKLDEFEQANATESEKAARRIAELEAQLDTTRRDSLRMKIAAGHGINDADDIDLFLTGADEETLTRQAERLVAREASREADREADRKKTSNYVPREGTKTTPTEGEERETTRLLFGGP